MCEQVPGASAAPPRASSSEQVILFPDFEKLQKEIEKLRVSLSMLILERDELRFVICKNLESAYMLQLGGLEYDAYKLFCRLRRLYRKIEIIQAKQNRQEKVDLSEIEKALDDEFAAYQKRLEEQIEKMNEAMRRRECETLSESDAAELKSLYRQVVKELHPDLHPDASEAQVELFAHAAAAYQNGDLQAMRVIREAIGDPASQPDAGQETMKQLVQDKNRLQGMIRDVQENIREIKTTYPYTLREILQSPEQVAKKKESLKEMIRMYTEQISACQAKVNEMQGVKPWGT